MNLGNKETANFSGSVNVGTASTAVLTENLARMEVIIVNDSAATVYLRLSTAATLPGTAPIAALGEGIRLNASGGSWSSENYTGPVSAIATAAGSNVTVTAI